MPKTVIAGAGYGSEEIYLYAIGDEKEPRFKYLIPFGMYLKEKSPSYKKNIRHAKNWDYNEQEDHFLCSNVLEQSVITKSDFDNLIGHRTIVVGEKGKN